MHCLYKSHKIPKKKTDFLSSFIMGKTYTDQVQISNDFEMPYVRGKEEHINKFQVTKLVKNHVKWNVSKRSVITLQTASYAKVRVPF